MFENIKGRTEKPSLLRKLLSIFYGRIHILAKKSFWPTFLQRILIEGAFFIYPKVFSSDEEMSGYKKLPKTNYTMLYQFQMLFEEDILDLFTFLYLVFHLKLYKERKSPSIIFFGVKKQQQVNRLRLAIGLNFLYCLDGFSKGYLRNSDVIFYL